MRKYAHMLSAFNVKCFVKMLEDAHMYTRGFLSSYKLPRVLANKL